VLTREPQAVETKASSAAGGSRAVNIRTAVRTGSLALVLGAVLLSALLSFFQFRRSLELEIGRNLQAIAAAAQGRVDAFFFERLEDVRDWRRLEVMQDIRVGDVDKRLARFLSELQAGHGAVYRSLYCTDVNDRIVAASDAALIGRRRAPGPEWLREARPGLAPVSIERLQPDALPPDGPLVVRVAIPDEFGANRLGYLYAVLEWSEVLDFLDRAAAGESSEALLLDADGTVLAASLSLRRQLALRGVTLSDWLQPGVDTRDGDVLGAGTVLVGSVASRGYQAFRGFGWHTLLVKPVGVALTPVWQLGWAMLGVLLVTLAIAAWVSSRLAERIAAPIVRLTEFTRRVRRGRTAPPAADDAAISEVRELSRAYAEMIDALARSQDQLVRAGKLAVVGEMAAIMAHEVRTPLGILRSSAQLLERQPELEERGKELTSYIKSESDRLNGLVTTLLECASPRAPDFRVHDVHDIVRHVLELIAPKAQKKGLRLEAQLEARDSIATCDREQLVQVLLNLVVNAIAFAPEGGCIRVHSGDSEAALFLDVDDTGPGILAEARTQVFDPFFTRREGGVGLGLTIVQQIVHAHGGEISVDSSPLGGARFHIRLPRNVVGGVPA